MKTIQPEYLFEQCRQLPLELSADHVAQLIHTLPSAAGTSVFTAKTWLNTILAVVFTSVTVASLFMFDRQGQEIHSRYTPALPIQVLMQPLVSDTDTVSDEGTLHIKVTHTQGDKSVTVERTVKPATIPAEPLTEENIAREMEKTVETIEQQWTTAAAPARPETPALPGTPASPAVPAMPVFPQLPYTPGVQEKMAMRAALDQELGALEEAMQQMDFSEEIADRQRELLDQEMERLELEMERLEWEMESMEENWEEQEIRCNDHPDCRGLSVPKLAKLKRKLRYQLRRDGLIQNSGELIDIGFNGDTVLANGTMVKPDLNDKYMRTLERFGIHSSTGRKVILGKKQVWVGCFKDGQFSGTGFGTNINIDDINEHLRQHSTE